MKKMSPEEMKTTTGGAISGSLLTGVGSIIEGLTNFITSMGGLSYVFGVGAHAHTQGTFKFGKNLSFDWDDTKPKGENLVKVDWSHYNQGVGEPVSPSDAYDLT